MYKYLFSIITILVISFSSCYKYSVVDLNPPNIRTTSDSTYLSSMIEANYDMNSLLDSSISYFYYDNLKRLTKIKRINLLNNLNDSSIIVYTYNANDTLPLKYTIDTKEVTYLFYNTSGQLIKEAVDTNGKRLETFEYTNNYPFIYVLNYLYDPTGTIPTLYQKDTIIIDANKNILNKTGYSLRGFPQTFNKDYYITSTYDNNPSPFYKINLPGLSYIFDYNFYSNGFANNKINNVINNYFGNYTVNVTNTYTYNTKNLPIKKTVNIPGQIIGNTSKIISYYKYISL